MFMRLVEITGYKKHQNKDIYELRDFLKEKFGVEIIGSGKYAHVFYRNGDPFVYKVYARDNCYDLFLDYVQANPSLHFPKIFNRKRISDFTNRPVDDRWRSYGIAKIEFIPQPITKDDFQIISYAERQVGYDYATKKVIVNAPDEYKPIVQLLHAIYENIDCSPDMHISNFRKRNDGTIVILDPLWYGSNPYSEYDEMMRAETDLSDEDDGPRVQGPWTPKKEEERNVELKKRREEIEKMYFSDDDIPF